MNWWIRFLLGLPARPEDVDEVRRVLPELFEGTWKPNPNVIEKREHFPIIWPFYSIIQNADELRVWANTVTDHTPEHEPRQVMHSPVESCPAVDCPLRSSFEQPVETDEAAPFLLRELMIAGGGTKPPKAAFLDFVRKVHKDTGKVKEVILTDRYILSDVGEDGTRGGLTNLIEYLEAIGLSQESSFTLRISPHPKYAGENASKILHRVVITKFRKATIDKHSPKFIFHDRLYLVRNDQGIMKGVFGPSLNGLDSKSIALMGEIEQAHSMQKLKSFVEFR